MNIFEWIKNKLSSKKDTNSTGPVSMPSVYWYCEDDAFPPQNLLPFPSLSPDQQLNQFPL